MSFDFRLKQFLKGVHYPRDVRLQAWMASFRKEGLDRILSRDVREHLNGYQPMQDAASEMAGVNFRDEVDRGGYFYQRMYLPGHILAKVDAASMTHSLEARAPFLDTELAEFANALPSRMKLRGMTRKYVLRRMLRGKLSDSILRRGKKGFGIPLAAWLKGPLAPMLDDLLHPDRLAAEGLFNAGEVTRLRAEHDAGHADNRKQLWTLVCFQAWRERFLD